MQDRNISGAGISRTAASFSGLSGNASQAASGSQLLAEAMRTQANCLSLAAEKARKKAECDSQAASAAKNNAAAAEEASRADQRLAESSDSAASASDRLSKSLDKAENEFGEYGESAKNAGRDSDDFGDKSKDAMEKLRDVLTSAGIVMALKQIGEEFLNCSNAAAEFETGAAKISTIADASQVSVSSMRSQLSALSSETGQSVSGLSDAVYQAISASVDTADAVKFVDEANMLAVGGFTQQAASADILTTAINAYGLEVSEAARVSDMLITTQNLGKTTVDELAQNMGRVIPLASAYNVEMDNLSAAYAQMTKNGIATAESTTYIKSMLSELGDTGSNVSKVLMEQTGQSFAQLMQDGYSLGDVLDIIGQSVEGDATAFNNLWSSQEAGIGALSLFNSGADAFNGTLIQMKDSAGATEKAYRAMTSTTEFASQRMSNSFANLEIAVGTQLNPVMEQLYNTGADILDSVTGFVEENPLLVASVSAVSTGLAAVTLAIGGFVVITKVAIPAVQSLTAAMNANPVFALVTAVLSVTAAVSAFFAVMDNSDSVEEYNGSLQECRSELESAKAEYAAVCQSYGENSQAVKELAGEIDTLNAQYAKGRGAIEDYDQRIAETADSLAELESSVKASNDSIEKSQTSAMAAASMLEALSQKSQITNSDLDMMGKYADYLNDTFNCNIKVNYDTGELTNFNPEDIVDSIIEAGNEKRRQNAMDVLADTDKQDAYVEAIKNLEFLKDEYARVGGELKKIASDFTYANKTGEDLYDEYRELPDKIKAAEDKIEGYNNVWREQANIIDSSGDVYDCFIESLKSAAESEEKLTDASNELQETISAEQAVSDVWSANEEEINKLAQAYEEAYGSIRENLDGMFGMFEAAQMEMSEALSFDGAIENLDSQIEYFDQYRAAVEDLSELDLDENILGSLDPEQAVAFSQELKNMDTETAKVKIDELNSKFAELSEVKDSTAETMADVETEFSKKLDEMQTDMESAIDNMNLDSEAAAAAKSTMNAYIAQLKASGRNAAAEAESIARSVSSALRSVTVPASMNVYGPMPAKIPGHALGTTNAEDAFISGENGPELILDKGGSTVFPAEETDKIVNAVYGAYGVPDRSDTFNIKSAPEPDFNIPIPDSSPKELPVPVSKRELYISINGKGRIRVSGGVDKEEVVQILYDHLRPVLADIISNDEFEEGVDVYEY